MGTREKALLENQLGASEELCKEGIPDIATAGVPLGNAGKAGIEGLEKVLGE